MRFLPFLEGRSAEWGYVGESFVRRLSNEKERKRNMKAMVIVPGEKGGTLEWRDVPDPEPGPGQLLMRVRAGRV